MLQWINCIYTVWQPLPSSILTNWNSIPINQLSIPLSSQFLATIILFFVFVNLITLMLLETFNICAL